MIDKDTFPKKLPPNPLITSLPPHLKDPKNYQKIRKAILNAGASKHSHSEVMEWAACRDCQGKQIDRLRMMKALGFKNGAQYMAWQKVNEYIATRSPLTNYGK